MTNVDDDDNESRNSNILTMSFEELRKSARQLEGEIDGKLVAFSKFASTYRSQPKEAISNYEATPLINGDDT